jgi:2-(1,2-epoxy-1,2-dihydrophenyl)acetyl-CoA isomerase
MDGATTTAKVETSVKDGIGTITLSDPATLNAAGGDLMEGLRGAFATFAADEAVRCVILTGAGRGFCSGANLSAGGGPGGGGPREESDAGASLETLFNPFITSLRDYPKPTVAAVNGAAAGVGASLAMACDIIVAGESAYFLQAFRRIGLVPDGGATYMLPRLIGKARAMELMLLGEKLPARTALEWGLINRCVADAELMPTAQELARALADGPKALAFIRRLVWNSLDADWAEQLHAERTAQRDAGRTEDFGEGVAAFLGKRPAQFKGR